MEYIRENQLDSYTEKSKDAVKSHHSKRRSTASSQDEIFDDKYKAAIKAYQNYMEGFQLMLAENERKMNNILDHRSVPLWFQELSDKQVVAMNQLLEAIRDDLDENSVFRCRKLIGSLGIYPLCPSKIFREALVLSHGNDLSFLWFLLELHYSKNRRQDYTNNERLLMSALCHLDMMTTLRGLDSILPPPAPKKQSCESLGKFTGTSHYSSPYLEPQRVREPCLKSTSGRAFQPKAPPFCLARYKQYSDPDFIIPNEKSRWFVKQARANQTAPSVEERKEEVQRKIPLSISPCGSAELIVRELLNDQIALMVGREQERTELCRKHQDMERRRKKLMGLLTKRTDVRTILGGE